MQVRVCFMRLMSLIAELVGALQTVKALSYTIAHPQPSHGWMHPERECAEEALPSLSIKIDPRVWFCEPCVSWRTSFFQKPSIESESRQSQNSLSNQSLFGDDFQTAHKG